VPVSCAAITETLMESEILGHEKGAFTGATAARRGRLELADGGTLFLDEIGELKPELQAKLLRVLQERRFERVGGSRTIEVDVRWISATNRDLEAMVTHGEFREDLYHRLAVFPIRLPPLRQRRQDLLPLAETLLARISAELGRPPLRLEEGARARAFLQARGRATCASWPTRWSGPRSWPMAPCSAGRTSRSRPGLPRARPVEAPWKTSSGTRSAGRWKRPAGIAGEPPSGWAWGSGRCTRSSSGTGSAEAAAAEAAEAAERHILRIQLLEAP
jgi:hypothetical protein